MAVRTLMLLFTTAALAHADDFHDSKALRKLIDTAEQSVVAVVVSHNPAYDKLNAIEKRPPGRLGDYVTNAARGDGIVPLQRDKLDLSLALNAADNIFGSGIVIDGRGYILTNYHLIQDARKIFLRYANGHGTYADIHAADARCDLAVLKPLSLPTSVSVKPVKLATVQTWDVGPIKANVYRGLNVLALAHPLAAGFNDGKASASTGIISNFRRRAANTSEETRTGPLHQYGMLLQTDARLAVGASGGGLFNADGEMIGLLNATAAIAGSETAGGYAVPMDNVFRRIIDVLKEGREVEYGFLGVTPSSDRFNPEAGLMINTVRENTPAGQAGLRPRDYITAIDGRPIKEMDDLFLLVGGALAGTDLKLSVTRQVGSTVSNITITPRLAKFDHAMPSIVTVKPTAVHGLRVEYNSLLAQKPVFFGTQPYIASGVLIREKEVEPNSPAAVKLAEFMQGKSYTITEVNGKVVTTPATFYRECRQAKSVTLTIVPSTDPNGTAQTVTLP